MEQGIAFAQTHAGVRVENNPDCIVMRYGLFSVEDARRVNELASQAPLASDHKVLIIAASRIYHEAQNALLKLFEEPPRGTSLYLIVPSRGALLPTLRSRVQILRAAETETEVPEVTKTFLKLPKEKRTAFIKKLATGKDEEDRRANRDEALAIVNGIEALAYKKLQQQPSKSLRTLLSETALFRNYLHERSAPVRMLLEHLSLVLPRDLL